MRTTKRPSLNEKQIAYRTAKTAVDVIAVNANLEFAKRGLVLTNSMPDDEFDKVDRAQEDIRYELGYYAALGTLHAAEEALLDWSFAATLKVAIPRQREELEATMQQMRQILRYRKQAIEMAMRLEE